MDPKIKQPAIPDGLFAIEKKEVYATVISFAR